MKTQKIIDIYGRKIEIAVDTKKVHIFDNTKKEIQYNAQIVENGEKVRFWTDFIEKGTLTDTEEKMNSFGNPIAFEYLKIVEFDAVKNDPEKKIWKSLIEKVNNNQSEFFTKSGNWKKRLYNGHLLEEL